MKGMLPSYNPEVFILSPEEEREYYQTQQIKLQRLRNGITIVGINREVTDLARVSVEWSFSSGYFFDPPGKGGLHHLVEHLLNREIRQFADDQDVTLRAMISPLGIREACWGPANPVVLNYGVWPILPLIWKTLISPLTFLRNPQEVIKKEIEVIKAEVGENYASHDWLTEDYLREISLDPANPSLSYRSQTPESLASLTLKDIGHLIKKILIPKDMIITLLTEGKMETRPLLVKKLGKLFEKFPRQEKKKPQIDWTFLDKLNPNFQPGRVYEKNTGLKNRLITLMFVWLCEAPPYSPKAFALRRVLLPFLDKKFFELCRKRGWGYTPTVDFWRGISTGILYFRLDLPKTPPGQLKKFSQKVQKETEKMLKSIDPPKIKKLLKLEQKRQLATPISANERLGWTLEGLQKWEKMIDTEKINQIYSQITLSHITQWKEKLLSEKPAQVIVGDLS